MVSYLQTYLTSSRINVVQILLSRLKFSIDEIIDHKHSVNTSVLSNKDAKLVFG